MLFSQVDFPDKDHEIFQFFHFQVLDLLKDTINELLIKILIQKKTIRF